MWACEWLHSFPFEKTALALVPAKKCNSWNNRVVGFFLSFFYTWLTSNASCYYHFIVSTAWIIRLNNDNFTVPLFFSNTPSIPSVCPSRGGNVVRDPTLRRRARAPTRAPANRLFLSCGVVGGSGKALNWSSALLIGRCGFWHQINILVAYDSETTEPEHGATKLLMPTKYPYLFIFLKLYISIIISLIKKIDKIVLYVLEFKVNNTLIWMWKTVLTEKENSHGPVETGESLKLALSQGHWNFEYEGWKVSKLLIISTCNRISTADCRASQHEGDLSACD